MARAVGRDALEGQGPQRRPPRRSDRRLEEVAEAVGGGYCRLQMPLKLALGRQVRGTVAGRRLGALKRGRGGPPFRCVPGCGVSHARGLRGPSRTLAGHGLVAGGYRDGAGGWATLPIRPMYPPPPPKASLSKGLYTALLGAFAGFDAERPDCSCCRGEMVNASVPSDSCVVQTLP